MVNRIVRIDDERNDLVRAMPEVHLWIDRWDEQRWSWGPFLAVAPGSRIIDAVGGGLMVGYRPRRSDQYSFNFGIGGILDLDTASWETASSPTSRYPRGKPAPVPSKPPAQGSSCSFRSDGICQPLASPHSLGTNKAAAAARP